MEPADTTSIDPAAPAESAAPKTSKLAGLKEFAATLKAAAEHLLEQARETFPPVDVGVTAFERDNHVGGFLLAGAIAFRMFVYVLPMYLLVLAVAGALFSFSPTDPTDAASSAGMSQYMADTIGDAAATSHKSLWLLLPVTLWALSSAGRALHKAVAAAHARAWGLSSVPKAKPHLVTVAVLGFAAAVLGGSRVVSVLRHGPLIPVAMLLAAVYYCGLWLLASRWLPRPEGAGWQALLPGAVLVALGSQALYLFNVLYLNRKIASASQAYGALGLAGSVLLWLYLLGRLMVAAPVLNATLWERAKDADAA